MSELIDYTSTRRIGFKNLYTAMKDGGKIDITCDETESYQILTVVIGTAKILGDIAEVGVYEGGSAKIICEYKGDKVFHLFDTFKGLPEKQQGLDSDWFYGGQYIADEEKVRENLKGYNGLVYHSGLFPQETGKDIENNRFSFVHLDVDLYQSTLDALEFFYPRMSTGGVIMTHDYVPAVGVRKAYDDFFKDKPEPILEMSRSQGLIVKL